MPARHKTLAFCRETSETGNISRSSIARQPLVNRSAAARQPLVNCSSAARLPSALKAARANTKIPVKTKTPDVS